MSWLSGWQVKDILSLTLKQVFLAIGKFEKFRLEELRENSVSRAYAGAVAFGSFKFSQFQKYLEGMKIEEINQSQKEADKQWEEMKTFGMPVEDKK